MTIYVAKDGFGAEVLGYLARTGPQTVDEIVAGMELPHTARARVQATVRNFRTRGRLVGQRTSAFRGVPTIYSVAPDAVAALADTTAKRPRRRKANPKTCPRRHRPYLPPRRPMTADQRRWIGYFIAAGWRPGTAAKLFGFSRRDVEPLLDAKS